MDTKKVRLPNKDEMLARLITVSTDDHMQQKFYPLMLEFAGLKLGATHLALRISLAVSDYIQGIRGEALINVVMLTPYFVDAILDDKEFAAEVKTLLR